MSVTLTITLGIIVICNFGVLWLYWKIYQWTRIPTEIMSQMAEIQAYLRKFARNTDYDFRALKTRERNQEKARRESLRRERAKA